MQFAKRRLRQSKTLNFGASRVFPDFESGDEVESVSDASVHGIGAVLLQADYPIVFEPHTFNDPEHAYDTGHQEPFGSCVGPGEVSMVRGKTSVQVGRGPRAVDGSEFPLFLGSPCNGSSS